MRKNNSLVNLDSVKLPENINVENSNKFLQLITKFCSYYKDPIK